MGVFDKIKKNLILKKAKKRHTKRTIKILPLNKYHSILIVLDAKDEKINLLIQKAFELCKITELYPRKTKEVSAEEKNYTYTFHISDLGFGKIKRDRLQGIINTNFDLVIDFSKNTTEFNYFVNKAKSTLKVGDLKATKNYLYDLLVERGNSNSTFIENIVKQINTLS